MCGVFRRVFRNLKRLGDVWRVHVEYGDEHYRTWECGAYMVCVMDDGSLHLSRVGILPNWCEENIKGA